MVSKTTITEMGTLVCLGIAIAGVSAAAGWAIYTGRLAPEMGSFYASLISSIITAFVTVALVKGKIRREMQDGEPA